MKIVKNTTNIDGRVLRSLICKVHAHMKRLEGRAAPNWKNLRIKIANRTKGGYRGWAYYYGTGRAGWDVHLSLPPNATERHTGRLVYHELMHTYGYRHKEYSNIPAKELASLFPEDKMIGVPMPAKAKAKAKYGEFPIKIQMTSKSIDEFTDAESGSYEDWLSDDRAATECNGFRTCHTVEILERYKTVIEIRNQDELEEISGANHYGLFVNYRPSASDRLSNELARHQDAIKQEAK